MKKYFFLIILLAFFFIPIHSYADISDFVIDNADTVANWTSSDSVDTPISQETSVKQEDTGSVKVTTTATTGSTIDLMEYSSDANAQTAYVSSYVGMTATGGNTITTSGAYTVHTFTGSGTFTPPGSGNVQALVVGAGGGSTPTCGAGGGGGGGGQVIYNSSLSVTAQAYGVTVGTGVSGGAGNSSSFNSITSVGGSAGGSNAGTGGTSGNGYRGGTGSFMNDGCGNRAGGGGGGASAIGTNGVLNSYGGNGGNGVQYSISGVSTYYGGGGGGGIETGSYGIGGNGGGGNGGYSSTKIAGDNGVTNTGGGSGGGGGLCNVTCNAASAGGSGIVIVRYPTSPVLQSYSESSIKTQGSYSLKGVARVTTSLNQTLTKTIASPLDFSNSQTVSLDIRSSRTGSNIKIGLHNTGGTTTEITPNITAANTFQTANIDLSSVPNANKDAIDQIIITIVNADADNTFYIDNFTSLKTSLNNTVTLTKSATNLSADTQLTFWVRSSLAGQTMRFQFGESSSSEQTYNFAINSANTWEQKTWDISGIAGTARDAVTQFAFKVIDFTNAQTFYFDDIQKSRPNVSPNAPTLDSPTDGVEVQTTSPTLMTTATDYHSDYLMYKIQLCSDAAMTLNCQTYDQTGNQTGWSGKNTQTNTAYSSGTQGVYIIQTPLTPDKTYYWRSYAKDPGGSNTWSATQATPYSFKTALISYSYSYCDFSGGGIYGQSTGNVTLGSSCVIYENVNGVVNGDLTVPAGTVVTLHRTLVFSPGHKINIEESGSGESKQTGLLYINTGGSIVQGKLCVKDANNNHYADTVAVTTDPYGVALSAPITQIDQRLADSVTNLCAVGYNYRETMNNLTMVDTSTSTNDTTKVATADRELLRLGFTVAGVKDALAVGNPVKIVGDNLLVCAGTVCPTVNFASDSGNIYATNRVGIGYTNPGASLAVNGSVGIGTASPVSLLTVGNSSTSQYAPSLTWNSPANLSLFASGQSLTFGLENASPYASWIQSSNVSNASLPLALNPLGGNVGIGTTNPTYALQVSGTVYASGSSRDYKEKIKPLEVDSSKIYNLKPVSYDYKKDYKNMGFDLAGGRQFGLIAEDVYPIIPELVISLGDKKTANIDYSKLSILLLDQMQKQKKEIDTLQQQVNSLQSEIDLIQKSLKISR